MIFDPDLNAHTRALADYMPNGRLFEAKNIADSNFRQLLKGLAGELFSAQGFITTLEKEYFPDLTVLFLSEWERALGMTDDCFSTSGSVSERRRNVLVKLASLGIQTKADFITLAAIFGVSITITSGSEIAPFPFSFPVVFFNDISDAAYTIIVDFPTSVAEPFPYDFPIIFGDMSQVALKCLFRQLIPVNCQIVFRDA